MKKLTSGYVIKLFSLITFLTSDKLVSFLVNLSLITCQLFHSFLLLSLGLEGFGIWRRDRDSKIGIGIRKSGSLFRDFGIIIGIPSRDFGIESPYLLILNEKYIDIPAAQSEFWFGGGSLQKFTLSL